MDDRLRALGRAARAEVEAGLDVDAELRTLGERTSVEPSTRRTTTDRTGRRGVTVWIAAAAAAAVALVGGVWLLEDDDDTIQTADPATTLPSATTVAPSPAPPDTTLAPATTLPNADPPDVCVGVSSDEAGVESISRSVIEARLAGRAPSIDGCLDAIPDGFDGSPTRCWACPGQTIGEGATGRVDSTTGTVNLTFSLYVSAPDGDTLADTVETWRFEVEDDLLVFTGVEFDEPLVSRADSLATIRDYFAAIESGDWLAAARMLDDGAVNPEERDDLQRLELDDYSDESVAAALEEWCATGCSTARPTPTDLEFDGYAHSVTRFGERITVVWYEGPLSIHGLPPRLPDEPADDEPADEVPVVDWRDLPYEASGISNSCVRLSLNCTRVIHDADGTPISLDPNTRVLTRHGVPEVSTTLSESYGQQPWLAHAGPDDVVYVHVLTDDPSGALVALSLAEDDAGREIARWDGIEGTSSESELVATPDGLVRVDCCGLDPVRPAPDAEVVVPWVDRNGQGTVAATPWIRATVASELTIERSDTVPAGTREWTFRPPSEWLERVMPQVTPTFDGGFVAALPTALPEGPAITIARGWPDGDVQQVSITTNAVAVAVDRSGRVLIGDGDAVWRVEPFPDRTERPAEQASIDVEAGTVTLPDLTGISADWLFDPVAFGEVVRGPLAVNEQRTIDAEQQSQTDWLVTVTTSNFFDDSVFADRWQLTLERGDDGRFAFVSGTWANSCQPGRGHQDFRADLCV